MPSRQRIKRNKSKKVGKYLTCNKKNYTFATLLQDSLAQLVEHNTFNVGVLGSNPKRITRRRGISEMKFLFFVNYITLAFQLTGLIQILIYW
jgi:hypothetical protein